MADPIRRKINSAAVSARLDPLFKHFFTEDLEFDLAVESVNDRFFVIFGILIAIVTFFVWHGVWPHFWIHVRITEVEQIRVQYSALRIPRQLVLEGSCLHLVIIPFHAIFLDSVN